MYLILNMFDEIIQHTSGCIFVTCVFVAPVENTLLSIAWRVSGDMKTDMMSLSLITLIKFNLIN